MGKKSNIQLSSSNAPNPDEWLEHFSCLNSLDPSIIRPVKREVDEVIKEVEFKRSSPIDAPSPLIREMDGDDVMKGIKALK